MIKVLIVDDHKLIRKGIIMMLDTFEDIKVVGEASEGSEAIRLSFQLNPDVIFMDISMPNGLDGFQTAKEIRQQLTHVRIIFLTMHEEEAYIKKALHLGVSGYLPKKRQKNNLYESIQQVMKGQLYYKTEFPDHLIELWKDSQKKKGALTERELEVLRFLVLGFTYIEIGGKMSISPKTIENHKANMMSKLEITHRYELIQYGLRNQFEIQF